jgi:hypothetical protein
MRGTPRVLDDRTHRRGQKLKFTQEFIDAFAKTCTGDLLCRKASWVNRTDYARKGDKLRYYPDEDIVIISRAWLPPRYCRHESDPDSDIHPRKEVYYYVSAVWIPSAFRFASTPAKKRSEFLRELATHYFEVHLRNARYNIIMSELPSYLHDHPDYIKAAERIIRNAPLEYRGRAVGWLQVDPEALCAEVQALAVESVLMGA